MKLIILAILVGSPVAVAGSQEKVRAPHFIQTHLVASKPEFRPQLAVEPNFLNAWGIAIRPAGAGGHFWVTARDKSYEYVGDVRASSDAALQTLFQDDLKAIRGR